MQKKFIKVVLIAVTTASILSLPTMNAQAGLLTKPVTATTEKMVMKGSVKDTVKEKKKEMRKDFLRRHGATEEDIQKLDGLHFFDMSARDFAKVDVGTLDEIIITMENSNIDIDIYINFITINK